MKSFKVYFESREYLYGWLSPNGEFISNGVNSHHTTAMEILRSKYKTDEYDQSMQAPMTELFMRGWQRISYAGNEIFSNNRFIAPNSKQLKELKNLAIENNFSEITFDNDEDSRTIWSR